MGGEEKKWYSEWEYEHPQENPHEQRLSSNQAETGGLAGGLVGQKVGESGPRTGSPARAQLPRMIDASKVAALARELEPGNLERIKQALLDLAGD